MSRSGFFRGTSRLWTALPLLAKAGKTASPSGRCRFLMKTSFTGFSDVLHATARFPRLPILFPAFSPGQFDQASDRNRQCDPPEEETSISSNPILIPNRHDELTDSIDHQTAGNQPIIPLILAILPRGKRCHEHDSDSINQQIASPHKNHSFSNSILTPPTCVRAKWPNSLFCMIPYLSFQFNL